eukprot:5773218-Ditylum_brightwellii.AAC.1
MVWNRRVKVICGGKTLDGEDRREQENGTTTSWDDTQDHGCLGVTGGQQQQQVKGLREIAKKWASRVCSVHINESSA